MATTGLAVPTGRALDCVTLGRANMDLYTEPERSIEETATFTKSVGGSPANIAAALARLGMRVGMITRAADDPVGRFVVRFLREMGVDTSRIIFDTSGASTSVAFAETRSAGSDTVLYRNNAADLRITPADIDGAYIASAAMLLVSGTALSVSPSRDATMFAIETARKAGTLVGLDIDYRPYSWPSAETASVALMLAAERCDIVIGTREEFDALELAFEAEAGGAPGEGGGASAVSGGAASGPRATGGASAVPGGAASGPRTEGDTARPAAAAGDRDRRTARRLLDAGVSIVVVKRGRDGSTAYTGDGTVVSGPVFAVRPAKVYGAGDAFAGALLARLLRGASLEDALTAGAANASINISKKRCAEDMATWEQITEFIKENTDALSHQTL